MGSARPLFRLLERDTRIAKLKAEFKAEIRKERQLRKDAEANAKRFHAMLIAERIRKL